jgi:hypothetical protein
MMSRTWTGFFWAAAVYNIVIGTLGFLDPAGNIDNKTIAVLVLAFGVVYLQVARHPLRLASVLWAGVFGKFAVVALLGPEAVGAGADPRLLPILAGDFLFGCGFLAFLLGPVRRHNAKGETA